MAQRRHSHLSHRAWTLEESTLRHVEVHAVLANLRLRETSKYTDDGQDPEVARTQLVGILDEHGWNNKVLLVAASGFFVDSYNLFASNTILPALAYVYWGTNSQTTEITLNALTLAGSAFGMVLFGVLADVFGRQRLYGVELLIVFLATLGFAASGPGISNPLTGGSSMSVDAWLMFWRFVMGIGVGAEYPLSACITVEWAAKDHRAQMLSAVFLMQPLGQFCAYGVGLAVLHGLAKPFGYYNLRNEGKDARVGIDILWRIVAGVGGAPALFALGFRWLIPESGRYTCDLKRDSAKALRDTQNGVRGLFESWASSSVDQITPNPPEALEMGTLQTIQNDDESHQGSRDHVAYASQGHQNLSDPVDRIHGDVRQHGDTASSTADHEPNVGSFQFGPSPDIEADEKAQSFYESPEDDDGGHWNQFSRQELKAYFIDQGNWRQLVGVSVCWFSLDFAFYGLGFNNPGTLAKLWTDQDLELPHEAQRPSWLTHSKQNGTILSVLKENGIRSIITVAIGSLLGCALLTTRIKFIDRRFALIWTSLLVALLLLITAIVFPYVFHTSDHAVLIALFFAIQFFFSFGPNTILFIIPAEIFPTRFRCTCYGIAAASGKLGAVFVQIAYIYFDNGGLTAPNSAALGNLMYLFAAFMLLVAIVAWAYIPNVQKQGPRVKAESTWNPGHIVENETLEDLADGRKAQTAEQRVGFRARLAALRKRSKREQHDEQYAGEP